MHLADIAKEVTLVHRVARSVVLPDSAAKVMALAEEKKINLRLNANVTSIDGNGQLNACTITDKEKNTTTVDTDYFIPLFGLSPKLGPIADWNLNLDKNAIEGKYRGLLYQCAGGLRHRRHQYIPGKLKLILCGFHEAALMSHSVYKS